jgi:hypothetical protein
MIIARWGEQAQQGGQHGMRKKKEKISFSRFQAGQMREMLVDMLLKNPELFEQLPGITAEQREAYERERRRMLERGNSSSGSGRGVCGAVCDS